MNGMTIIGLGVDLVRVSRFGTLLEKQKRAVLERLFTPGELAYAFAKKDPSPHLAARFAAKEAFLKALGLGLRQGLNWQQIEVVADSLGKPSLVLSGKAAEIMLQQGANSCLLSYSHDGDYATATVILEGPWSS
jgi:holo-[acyl-carrier protein] synthase